MPKNTALLVVEFHSIEISKFLLRFDFNNINLMILV